MYRARSVAAAVVALVTAVPADAAAPRPAIALSGGPLADAVIALGRQAGVSIGVDPALGALPVTGLAGTMSVERALSRLLSGLPARAERIDSMTWRIVRASPAVRLLATRRPSRNTLPPEASSAEIVVTATKRDTRLDRYPGTAYVESSDRLGGSGAAGSDAIVERFPTLASTALGPGRNKLFIRGIADSSFNGPSQATVGQYLGDLRLNYNAPDPNLTLADIGSVEVLEGPQGTLYGAGALGGIVRLVPNPVALDRAEGALSAGYALTAHADASNDVSGVVNLPLITDRLGVRVVGYRSVDGGTIDDVGRGLRDVNRTRTAGARATIRFASADGWIVDLAGVAQQIDSADAQYAERGLPPRSRSSRIAQPFDSDYGLGGVTIARDFESGLSIRSASAVVLQDVDSTYDFTPAAGAPTLFEQHNRIRLISNETRVSRRDVDGIGWVAGIGLLHDSERLTRLLGPVASPTRIVGVSNTATDYSAFAELSFRLTGTVIATVGGRFDLAHLTGEVLDRTDVDVEEPRRDEISLVPSLALAWHPQPGATLFVRYQRGFRPGDLAVSAGAPTPVVQRFHGDHIGTAEIGGRVERQGFDASATLSYAHWVDIQADLVDAGGLPITANIGNGKVLGFEAQAGWRPVPALRLAGAVFFNHSRLDDPSPGFETASGSALPNVAKLGARASLDFSRAVGPGLTLTGGASVRYVGPSRLGVGPALAFLQGRYFDTAARVRLGTSRFGVSLDASNLLGAAGNRFALGNPFDVADGRQFVPLRPRTFRLGVDAQF